MGGGPFMQQLNPKVLATVRKNIITQVYIRSLLVGGTEVCVTKTLRSLRRRKFVSNSKLRSEAPSPPPAQPRHKKRMREAP